MTLENRSTCLMTCQSSLLPKKPRFLSQKMWAPHLVVAYLIFVTLGEFLHFSGSLCLLSSVGCSLFPETCKLTFIKPHATNCEVISKPGILFLSAKPQETEESRKKGIRAWKCRQGLRESLASHVSLP